MSLKIYVIRVNGEPKWASYCTKRFAESVMRDIRKDHAWSEKAYKELKEVYKNVLLKPKITITAEFIK